MRCVTAPAESFSFSLEMSESHVSVNSECRGEGVKAFDFSGLGDVRMGRDSRRLVERRVQSREFTGPFWDGHEHSDFVTLNHQFLHQRHHAPTQIAIQNT